MSDELTPTPDASTDEPTETIAVEDAGAAPDADGDANADAEADHFNKMSIESVLFDLSDSSPLVHMIEDQTPYRYLAIPIALPEAIALHNAIDVIDGRRPGTHEVMSEVLRRLNANIVAARITRYENGVFHAELDLMTAKGREVFDCRTSDALILAMRQRVRAPVMCAESVLQAFYE